ncbi:NAD(P)-dependent benzaldehyde dehydrogenase [BD1-7 clade bacterium]|uniref:Aldehyde dehydrogenase n=1 Tax=BD1-7 clade bacterium TaxID=2029982 RepID=A0A5S9PZ69_9GAMM|nr:NAD(P)-dependent benzaldehyde dehydrogenase [BD1-7 clade bacterium]CAA0112680.1 NAD(P)-dependent benzaldehyde dehydrogenase [BD1-7 clade bacterium]
MSAVAQHVADLKATFRSGKTRSYEWRLHQLEQLVKLIDENEEKFVDALKQDSGKSEFSAFAGEILFVRAEAMHAIKHLKKWMKPKKVGSPLFLWPCKSKIQPTPYGVMLIGVAWNFPLHLTIGPLAASLAAGNTALIKPPSMSPAYSALIEELIPQYLDNDAVRVHQPQGPDRDELLRQKYDLILYTGSYHVGQIVMRAAAEHLTPVLLELGGKNPCVIAEDAKLDATANRIIDAKFLNAGQVCVTVDYILVHESIKDALVAKLKEKVEYMFGDNPKESLAYSRIINSHHYERIKGLLSDGDIVVGGQCDPEENYVSPTVLDNVSLDSEVMKDEIFGPILPVVSYKNKQDILDIMARYGKPLCLYIFTENTAFADDLINSTESGSVGINSIMLHMPNHDLPFGGVGESGMGQYHGKYGFDAMSHMRPIVNKPTWLDIKQSYPPIADRDELDQRKKAMRFLMK